VPAPTALSRSRCARVNAHLAQLADEALVGVLGPAGENEQHTTHGNLLVPLHDMALPCWWHGQSPGVADAS